ncbi:response regulator [Rhodobacteraceae bacterium NNCM2]|nr:response regulator [Coraliihabitans acroporae]
MQNPVDAETADHLDAFVEQSLGYLMLRLAMAAAITAVMLFSNMIATGLIWGSLVAVAELLWTSRSKQILARRGLMMRADYYKMVFLNLVLVCTYMFLGVFLVMEQTPLMVLASVIWVAGGFFAAVLVLVPDRVLMATTYGPAIAGMIAVANMMDWSWNDRNPAPDSLLTFAMSIFFSMFIVRAFMMAGDFQKQAYNDQQALERRRAAAERASVNKTAFLARMSHEIRTPLNGVLGCASLLSQTTLDPRQKHLAGQILRSGDTLLAVLNDVLDISRIEVGGLELEMQTFDLNQLFEDTVNLMIPEAEHRGVVIMTHVDNRLPQEMIGDVPRIRQILLNLLSNAVKFNEAGELQAAIWHDGITQDPGVNLTIELVEAGLGMKPLMRFGPYDPFSDSYQPGEDFQKSAGLGLIISRDLAEQMNGAMSLEENGKGGLCLKVTLPLAASPETLPIGEAWRMTLAGSSLLLVASDDYITRRHTESLQAAGLRVHHAHGFDDALAVAEAQAAAGRHLDFVAVSSLSLTDNTHDIVRKLRAHPAFSMTRFISNSGRTDRCSRDITDQFDSIVSHSMRPKRLPAVLAQMVSDGGEGRKKGNTIPDLRGCRILLAEDDVSNQMLLTALLEPTGAKVDLARDGVEALDAVIENPPDLILMDIRMPRMDGTQAASKIRESLPSDHRLKIIAVSANAKLVDRRQYLEAGMDAYLAKPVVVDEIYGLLRTHLLGDEPENPTDESLEPVMRENKRSG